MQEILEKLKEHDKKFSEHDKRFDQIDEQMDFIALKVSEHDNKLDKLTQVVDGHTVQLDRITHVVVNHTERLERIEENMATKDGMNRINNTLDKLIKLAETKDQELTLIAHGLRVVEDKVEQNTKDIQRMKPILGLS